MQYYIYYDYYHKNLGDNHLIIILPISISGYNCKIFDENEKIIPYIGNWLNQNVSLSYNEYLNYRKQYNELWWFRNVIFIDSFRYLNEKSKYEIKLFDSNLTCVGENIGNLEDIINFYINFVYKCGFKNRYFMKKINISIKEIKEEYIYIYQSKQLFQDNIVIILPIKLNDDCNLFDSSEKILNLASYDEYKQLKNKYCVLDIFDKLKFIEQFRNLDVNKKYNLELYSCQNTLEYKFNGCISDIANIYIDIIVQNDSGKIGKIYPHEFNIFVEEM